MLTHRRARSKASQIFRKQTAICVSCRWQSDQGDQRLTWIRHMLAALSLCWQIVTDTCIFNSLKKLATVGGQNYASARRIIRTRKLQAKLVQGKAPHPKFNVEDAAAQKNWTANLQSFRPLAKHPKKANQLWNWGTGGWSKLQRQQDQNSQLRFNLRNIVLQQSCIRGLSISCQLLSLYPAYKPKSERLSVQQKDKRARQ